MSREKERLEIGYPRRNIILRTPKLLREKRIRTTTCGRRRAREDVQTGKWQGVESLPLIQQNCMKIIMQKENLKTKTLKRKLLRGAAGAKSRGIYSKERFSRENMLALDQGDIKGVEHEEAEEEQFSEEARKMAERVHRAIGTATHWAVGHRDWTSEGIGEAIYTYTLWIMRWEGNDSMGSKINRRSQVEAELEIPIGDKGEYWQTISNAQWRVVIKDQFILHVLVSPIEICEILMEWNHGLRLPRQKLRIGSAGNAGAGNPAINALWDVIAEKVGNNSIGEVKKDLASRGIVTEIPAPTYGYMRRDEFYVGTINGDLANEWVMFPSEG